MGRPALRGNCPVWGDGEMPCGRMARGLGETRAVLKLPANKPFIAHICRPGLLVQEGFPEEEAGFSFREFLPRPGPGGCAAPSASLFPKDQSAGPGDIHSEQLSGGAQGRRPRVPLEMPVGLWEPHGWTADICCYQTRVGPRSVHGSCSREENAQGRPSGSQQCRTPAFTEFPGPCEARSETLGSCPDAAIHAAWVRPTWALSEGHQHPSCSQP